MKLSQKHKIVSHFLFFCFLNFLLDSILNIFEKNMTLRADVFLNLRTTKDVVREMSKKSRFRGPLEK